MCCKCESYKKQIEKYKRRLNLIESGLSEEDKILLIETICSEQTNMIQNKSFTTDRYNALEQLKIKIKYL